jgi:hypothetical protein
LETARQHAELVGHVALDVTARRVGEIPVLVEDEGADAGKELTGGLLNFGVRVADDEEAHTLDRQVRQVIRDGETTLSVHRADVAKTCTTRRMQGPRTACPRTLRGPF